MRYYIIFTLIISISSRVRGSKDETIDASETVREVNNSPGNTWQASTYDHDYVKVDDIRAKLGFQDMDSREKHDSAKFGMRFDDDSESEESPPPPLHYDIREQYPDCKSVNFIWDQANCASDWAIATLSSINDRFCIRSQGEIDLWLSPQHLTSCDDKNKGCKGGSLDNALNYLKYKGTVTGGDYESDEGCQPYELHACGYPQKMPCSSATSLTPKCKRHNCTNEYYDKYEKNIHKIKNWYKLPRKEDKILREIFSKGSILAGLYIYEDFIFYKKGIYKVTGASGRIIGGHAVKILGWGEENGVKYWLAANSWGSDWGENGFFRIRRGFSDCYVEHYMYGADPLIK